ncbi:MAG: amidase, partial [Pseudomonadota bacterium]
MQEQDYVVLTATEIAARVQRGELSAREVISSAFSRIEATEPRANAFIHLDREKALAEAERIDADRSSGKDMGSLAGVPVSVKDMVHVAGMPTSSGSAVFAGKPAPEDAAPVARLRAAGAVIIGKTTTPEFGHKPFTDSPLFGRTLNPWNPDYTSGGSSGGAAVSVALRQVPLAIGTDGGGSV